MRTSVLTFAVAALEQNESEKALTQSKSLLKALEGMHISQADKMRADVYR